MSKLKKHREETIAALERVADQLKYGQGMAEAGLNELMADNLARLQELLELQDEHFRNMRRKQATVFRKEIARLQKAHKTTISENFLLEYKKKDLMLLADQLEEANEEISQKNQKLRQQKEQISRQAAALKEAHEAILLKNEELEQQKEEIQNQADYLHDANQAISKMHAEVAQQKDEILAKNKKLLSLNEEKNNLIGIVAHDLKSPLNQIQGLISLIHMTEEQSLSADGLMCLEKMDKSAKRLSEMIHKILDVKAIEAEEKNMLIETMNLAEVARDCADRFALTANEKQIELITQIPDELVVKADSGYLIQVLDNLLSNALKFSQPHTEVMLIAREEKGEALLEVRDQGPGLTPEDMKKLFGRFQKLSARPTGNETSTGLGLSIVKQFVEAMEGRIWCESTAGKGASFFVAFSLVRSTHEKQLQPSC